MAVVQSNEGFLTLLEEEELFATLAGSAYFDNRFQRDKLRVAGFNQQPHTIDPDGGTGGLLVLACPLS